MIVLITHLHGDHVNGLLGLLQTMGMSQRIRTLTIVAPPELFGWLKMTMKVLHIGLTFDVSFVPVRPGAVHRGKDFRVRAAKANHSIDSWSYLFEELPRPGVFDRTKAVSLGIPEGKKWSSLQRWRSVVVGGVKFSPGPGARAGQAGKVDRVLRGYKTHAAPHEVLLWRRPVDLRIDLLLEGRGQGARAETQHCLGGRRPSQGGGREEARPHPLQREV